MLEQAKEKESVNPLNTGRIIARFYIWESSSPQATFRKIILKGFESEELALKNIEDNGNCDSYYKIEKVYETVYFEPKPNKVKNINDTWHQIRHNLHVIKDNNKYLAEKEQLSEDRRAQLHEQTANSLEEVIKMTDDYFAKEVKLRKMVSEMVVGSEITFFPLNKIKR